jgi:hypothetical protein
MVCITQNYWVFGLNPSSGILKTREHNISENGPVSVLRRGRRHRTLLGPLERATLNHWTTHVSITTAIQIPETIVFYEEPGLCSQYSDWLRAGRLRGRSSSPGRVKNVLFSKSSKPPLGVHPTSYPMDTGGYCLGCKEARA